MRCVAREEVANITLWGLISLNAHTHRKITANKLCLVITVATMECVVWAAGAAGTPVINVSQCCSLSYSTVQQQVKAFISLKTRELP